MIILPNIKFYTLTIWLLISITLISWTNEAEAHNKLYTIPTRPGVTLDFLIISPEKSIQNDAIIMFTGGNGAVPFRLTENGSVSGWNFLIRTVDDFIKQGLTVVAIRPPSDHKTGMTLDFRESQEHAEDILHLANYLESQGIKRIFFAGNSRGTLSAASLATRISDEHIKGVILTSTLESDFLKWIPMEKVLKPVLMVHHRTDQCRVSPFSEAIKTSETMKISTKVDFVEVNNSGYFQMSEPCNDLSSHGFFGMEEKVVQVIADWIKGREIPNKIE